jgi:hypothetical protein
MDGFQHLSNVKVAGSNPVVRSEKSSRSIAFGFTEVDGVAVIQPFGCVVASRTCAERLSDRLKGAIERESTRSCGSDVLGRESGFLGGGHEDPRRGWVVWFGPNCLVPAPPGA